MFYFVILFAFYLKNINAKSPITCTILLFCADYRVKELAFLQFQLSLFYYGPHLHSNEGKIYVYDIWP